MGQLKSQSHLLPVAAVQSPRSCWAAVQTQSPAGPGPQTTERSEWLGSQRTGHWEGRQI